MYGSKILAVRLVCGLTQKQMAMELGMTQTEYSRIENNQKSRLDEELLCRIGEVFGIDPINLRSPLPIIMNFPDSFKNLNEKMIDELTRQLKVKDEQIAILQKMIMDKRLKEFSVPSH